jgi:hypothetical protein|nr:MAG TPA: Major capsid protein [Caudoviricetes sp.]
MAVTTFIPAIWNARLMHNFYERSIANVITTPAGEIRGNKLIFNNVSDVTVKDYSGSVSFDELTTSKVELEMDIKKMWAFKVNDVDAVQAAGDLVDAHTQEASSKMQTAMDKAILDEGLETTNEVTKVGEEKAYDLIVKANTALNKNKVPKTDRFVVVNAEVLEELHLDDRFNRHYQILENGVIEGASVNGTQLVYSEELNGGSYAILALHKTAIGFGTQLQETEAMRLESDFADGIRGLQVAGAKTLRPKAVVKYVQE